MPNTSILFHPLRLPLHQTASLIMDELTQGAGAGAGGGGVDTAHACPRQSGHYRPIRTYLLRTYLLYSVPKNHWNFQAKPTPPRFSLPLRALLVPSQATPLRQILQMAWSVAFPRCPIPANAHLCLSFSVSLHLPSDWWAFPMASHGIQWTRVPTSGKLVRLCPCWQSPSRPLRLTHLLPLLLKTLH